MRKAALECAATTSRGYLGLPVLETDSIALFRDSFFRPQRPVILPRGLYLDYPAASRWFSFPRTHPVLDPHASNGIGLNYEYLGPFGDCQVPLELTTYDSKSTTCFERAYKPLSLFLEWTRLAQSCSAEGRPSLRLYLAQCQIIDLPSTLRDDLPTPSYVAQSGKGDIYDTNIWLGIAPTYTPLHRDPNPNLFVQLAGSKCIRLLPPDSGLDAFKRARERAGLGYSGERAPHRGEEMMQGQEKEALEHETWDGKVLDSSSDQNGIDGTDAGYHATVNAGDAIFIPRGWWHSIKGVGDGVTASVSHISKSRSYATVGLSDF
ncbi:hypothetical protein FQN57_000304 [Myotisia sp. PD_48]|nr:hypothetical protein FQN57_000304 [Myotisia sp. PD_48]